MKFSANLSDFQKSIQRVLPAIPPKSTLPVLEHLNFSLKGNDLRIIATDQDITISTSLEVTSEEEGSVLVPGRKINDIVKALGSSGSLHFFNDDETFDIELKTARGKYKMKGLNPEDYLDLPELFESKKPDADDMHSDGNIDTGNHIAKFTPDEIKMLCSKTSSAVSTDEFRPAMTGVLFQFRESYVNAVATDSYRLVRAVVRSENAEFPQDFDVIIPKKSVDLIKNADDELIMSVIESNSKVSHLRFDYGSTVFITRVIDEKFPPYESVIPENNDLVATVDLKEILSAINRVSIFANALSKQIRVELSNNLIVLSGEDEESGNKAREEIACEYDSTEFDIGFNFKYLDEAIKNIDSSETTDNLITISFSEPTKPALVRPKNEEDNLLMLIMPVRL